MTTFPKRLALAMLLLASCVKLYDSENPEAELHKLYGESREALVRAAMID